MQLISIVHTDKFADTGVTKQGCPESAFFHRVRGAVCAVLMVAAMGVATPLDHYGPSTINQITFSEDGPDGENGLELRVHFHSDSEIAWYSLDALEEENGIRATFLNTGLSEDFVSAEAITPIRSFSAEEQNGKVVAEFVFDAPGIMGTVSQEAGSYNLVLKITGYASGLAAINRAYGSDTEAGPAGEIVSLLSSNGRNFAADSSASEKIDSLSVLGKSHDEKQLHLKGNDVLETDGLTYGETNVDQSRVSHGANDSIAESGTDKDDVVESDNAQEAAVSVDATDSEKSADINAPRRADLFVPKKLSTAGPALLPKAPDVAAVESSVIPESNSRTSGAVLSDIERMFASSLGKSQEFPKMAESSVANNPAPTPIDSTPGSKWKLDTVVLDAGHGGWDEGAFGTGGALEKNVALKLALELGQMLGEKLGLNVVYTRTDDRFVTLADRGRIANQAGAKLFLSIHANSSKFTSASGTETFFLGVHRSDSAQVVMERENEVVKLEEDDSHYAEYTSASLAQQALAQSSFMRRSEMLAEAVQAEFREGAFRRDRGVKQAGFYVLFGASMPAVLIELGFLTNPYEEKFLSSSDGQTTMANAIFRAIEKYKIEYERTLQVASQ